jgi:hypothetical protein
LCRARPTTSSGVSLAGFEEPHMAPQQASLEYHSLLMGLKIASLPLFQKVPTLNLDGTKLSVLLADVVAVLPVSRTEFLSPTNKRNIPPLCFSDLVVPLHPVNNYYLILILKRSFAIQSNMPSPQLADLVVPLYQVNSHHSILIQKLSSAVQSKMPPPPIADLVVSRRQRQKVVLSSSAQTGNSIRPYFP